ncbi:MAG: serine hydrolase domain-containing protein [Chitinophagales bacterium]
MTKIQFLFLGFLLTSSYCFGQNVKFADSVRIASNIPELSYAVITGKSIIEINALGYHSSNKQDTANLNDRFHLGSNTKAMTAFLIAKYVDKGKLKWTEKFFDLYPEWRNSSRAEYYNITLQELLSHRAFIQPFQGFDDPIIPNFSGSKQEKREAFGKFVLTLDPANKDSSQTFVYSNAGYTLAALMLEKVTNKSWEELINKVFNQDLHLNVQISWPENQTNNDTWGHSFENGQLIPVPSNTDYHLDYTEPAGDINIKLKDYIKFLQLNLQGLSGKNNYLKAKTYNFIHTGITDYSLGWYNIYEYGKELSTHSGTAGTYYVITHIDRQKKIAYIIFTNSFTDETQNGVRILMRKLKKNYGG